MNIAVIGACGKLGSKIVDLLEEKNMVVQKIDTKLGNKLTITNIPDAVIDASHKSATISIAEFCNKFKVPLLICTTGHTNQEILQINNICKNIPYCLCANLSMGIQYLLVCLNNLEMLTNFKASITEVHHVKKADSPSGTAKVIASKLYNISGKDVEISSIRRGEEIGTHVVTISLPGEEISISHKVNNRKIFALGAVYIIQKLPLLLPKEYTFLELLGGNNG